MNRTNGVPIGVTVRGEYFDGCDNVPMFDLERCEPIHGPLSPTPNVTLADAVHAAETRRADSGQLALPAEILPTPAGQLFA